MSHLSSRLVAMSAAVLTLAALLVGTVAVAPPAAAAFPDGTVNFEGHGWGHGRGLGQYGSYGYAVDHGRDYSWIVDHFYGGTTKGTKADGTISVKLIYLDGRTTAPTDMTVTSGSPFTIGSNTFAAGEWGRVAWNGDGWDIERADSCAGEWTEAQVVGPAARPEAKTAYAGDDIAKMLSVLQPAADQPCTSWNKRSYRGSLMIAVLDDVFTRVLNWVPMEQYLRGVVPRESPASWGSAGGGRGMEALKAQSIAARSYAWAESRHSQYKTCDTTACQVYGGAGLNGLRIEDSRTDAAIAATAGEVRVNANGSIARTEFSSSTGGHTAGPYFVPVPDAGDATPNNPNHEWSVSVPVSTIEGRYPQIGSLQSIGVLERNGLGAMGGRVESVRLVGSNGSVTLTGDGQIRGGLGLKSAWFKVVDVVLDVTRLQGVDRIGTSNAISGALFADGEADAAILVSGYDYPDAIVGVPLAAANNAPILLSEREAVPDSTMAELERVTGGGAPVYLLGGTVPLAESVAEQLTAAGYEVTRYGGETRAATAVLVAEALGHPGLILQATGANFPDALAAGAAAAEAGGAVLLTAGATQAPETAAYLEEHPGAERYAVGGAAADADPTAVPLVGGDRYETAIEVANQFFPGPVVAGLASGTGFADALSGGVHAANQGGPLVLTAPRDLPISTEQYLQGNADLTLRRLFVYGGQAAVDDVVLDDLEKR